MSKLIITTIEKQPEDFKLLAQNMQTYEICGHTEQDGFDEVSDIPYGFVQRVLPPQYGEYLTLLQITNGLLMEQGGFLEDIRQHVELDYRITLLEMERGK